MSEEIDKPEAQAEEEVKVGEPESEETTAESAGQADAGDGGGESEVTMDPKEIEDGKVVAIISYIIPLVALIPLIQRNNAFSLYHAKQVLVLMIAGIAMGVVNVIPCIGQIICAVGGVFIPDIVERL